MVRAHEWQIWCDSKFYRLRLHQCIYDVIARRLFTQLFQLFTQLWQTIHYEQSNELSKRNTESRRGWQQVAWNENGWIICWAKSWYHKIILLMILSFYSDVAEYLNDELHAAMKLETATLQFPNSRCQHAWWIFCDWKLNFVVSLLL